MVSDNALHSKLYHYYMAVFYVLVNGYVSLGRCFGVSKCFEIAKFLSPNRMFHLSR